MAALERLGYACKDNGLLFSINAHMWTAIIPLVYNGTEAQKKKYLPGLCNGTLIGGNAMSEPNSGSDAFSLATTAIKKGSKYILNGSKIFVTNGPDRRRARRVCHDGQSDAGRMESALSWSRKIRRG